MTLSSSVTVMNERNDMQAKLGTADRRHTILIIGISCGIVADWPRSISDAAGLLSQRDGLRRIAGSRMWRGSDG
ncbi:MAG TPA: hypothetical protein VF908_07900 [Gemmatimonadaceae bacterium]